MHCVSYQPKTWYGICRVCRIGAPGWRTGSRCNWLSTVVMRSCRLAPVISRAAAFWTDCTLRIILSVTPYINDAWLSRSNTIPASDDGQTDKKTSSSTALATYSGVTLIDPWRAKKTINTCVSADVMLRTYRCRSHTSWASLEENNWKTAFSLLSRIA